MKEGVVRGSITKQECTLLRVEQTAPVFKKIKGWLTDAKSRAVEGSQLAKVVHYYTNSTQF